MANELVTWLEEELESRGWSQRELARRAGIAHTTVSYVLAGRQAPSWDFCAAIAEALGLAPTEVFVLAGLLPPPLPAVAEETEAVAILRELDPEARAHALAMLRGLAELAPSTRPRIVGLEQGEVATNVYGVPLDRIRAFAERVARLPEERQARVMDAFFALMDAGEG
jgi:transcriptional regulator with XRE-family HTH domain